MDNSSKQEKEHKMSDQDIESVPDSVKKMLESGEQVIGVLRQSRLKELVTPDTLIFTDRRIIRHAPSSLGLKVATETYLYQDMATFTLSKGVLFCSITIRTRMMSDSLVVENLEKGPADAIAKAVNQQIQIARSMASSPQAVATNQPEDPLKVLQLRLVKGEITKEQFEELKKLLEP
jgi:hypothetical protein